MPLADSFQLRLTVDQMAAIAASGMKRAEYVRRAVDFYREERAQRALAAVLTAVDRQNVAAVVASAPSKGRQRPPKIARR